MDAGDTAARAQQEKGDWEVCLECLRANKAEAAKFSFKHLEAHAEALGEALAANTSVRYLDLSCNSFSPAGAAHLARGLAKNKTLQMLDLSANALQSAGTCVLLKALADHPALAWLDLHANTIRDDAVVVLAEFLRRSASVRSLNVRANYLTDAKVDLLADVLKDPQQCKLEQVDWGANDFSRDGEAALVAAAKANPFITSLKQSSSSILTDVGCVVS